jgi:AraC-like DNA-binding protein
LYTPGVVKPNTQSRRRWLAGLRPALARLPVLRDLERIQIEEIWARQVHTSHTHELIHVRHGHARILSDRRAMAIGPHDTIIIPRGTPHRDLRVSEGPYQVLMASFDWPGGGRALRWIDSAALVRAPAGQKAHLHLLTQELEQEYLADRPDAAPRTSVVLVEILLAMMRYSAAPAPAVPQAKQQAAERRRRELTASVRQYLLDHYDQNVSLETLAAAHRVSTFHLSRCFSSEFGMSISDALAVIRMDQAKELLAGGRLSVKEVAARLNYSTGNYFAKAFRRICGLSPSEYQANHSRSRTRR